MTILSVLNRNNWYLFPVLFMLFIISWAIIPNEWWEEK